jgi:hypothetical protein
MDNECAAKSISSRQLQLQDLPPEILVLKKLENKIIFNCG